MKNKIIFALLTAIAAVAGLKLSSLSNGFLGRNDDGETVVKRSDIRTDALYIAQNEEELFDMFSLAFDAENAFPLAGSELDKLCQLSVSEVAELAVIDLCSCREEYAFGTPAKKSVAESLLTNGSDKIALKKYPYYNPAGELRYLDLVADWEEFHVQYVRFYADEEDVKLSAAEMEQAISRASDDLIRFSDSVKKYDYGFEWLTGGAYSINDMYSENPEDFVVDSYGLERDELIAEIKRCFGECREFVRKNCDAPGGPAEFARDLSSCSFARLKLYLEDGDVSYDEFGGASIYAELIRFCADEASIAGSASYSAYGGEIYQTLNYEDAIDVITIFNARECVPAGFFISDSTSSW